MCFLRYIVIMIGIIGVENKLSGFFCDRLSIVWKPFSNDKFSICLIDHLHYLGLPLFNECENQGFFQNPLQANPGPSLSSKIWILNTIFTKTSSILHILYLQALIFGFLNWPNPSNEIKPMADHFRSPTMKTNQW